MSAVERELSSDYLMITLDYLMINLVVSFVLII